MAENNINIIMIISENDMAPYAPASLAGLPIISIPAGITKEGFPFGVSFYTVPRHECLIFSLARAVEDIAPSRTPPTFLYLSSNVIQYFSKLWC
ncbi:Trimeric GatFAB AmidoTransferase(AdT) complex subunit [Entomophthora muscae]|uniref:Trimeric GatFAB AmidoTransferase(AdT) complex subunit n=1 Tax=Entomophthora muscae TaxID=34485 RepID=A0ACC2U2E7_9FUNG|nr:Trimeric GatFAB AmidoTransferase(AdT) complex subunit [Entomophthora muscae]